MSLRNVEITIPHYYPDLLTLRLPLTGSREAHESFEFTHPFNQAILEHFTNIQAKCQSREVALTVGGLEHLSKQERSAETDRRYFDLLQIYMIKESNCSLNGRNARYCHVLLSSIFPTSETSQEFQEGVAVHLEEGWGWSRSAAILAQVIEHLRSR